jgi:hypothetical protein
MKRFRPESLLVAALALMLSACEKNVEDLKTVSEVKVAAIPEVVYPLVGTDTSNYILPSRKLPNAVLDYGSLGEVYPNLKVNVIDTVCTDYLRKTIKFDLSTLADGGVTNLIQVEGNAINIDPDFRQSLFKKLSPGPNGWWTHWNYSPYTESENPIVLYPISRSSTEEELYPLNTVSIALRQQVRTFGFEIAPNATGKDIEVNVTYKDLGSDYRGPSLFDVHQTISSPSGARLIAVTSNVPFGYLEISISGGEVNVRNKGFAIANIRVAN